MRRRRRKVEMREDRFKGPADVIELKKLYRRKYIYMGLAIAVAFHIGLGVYFFSTRRKKRVAKPPVVELIVRKPRMTKPFEFKKRRVPKRVMMRKVVSAKPMLIKTITKKIVSPDLFGTVATFGYHVESGAEMGFEVVQPEVRPASIATSKEPEKRISMEEELLDLEALDTGKYRGLVIQDPRNKKNIKGFVYLARLRGNTLYPAVPGALPQLVRFINENSGIRAKVAEDVYLDSKELFRCPFVYLTAREPFEATRKEVENLREYLKSGGFVFVDNVYPKEEYSPSEASLRKLIRDALGREARFEMIPNDHPLYHCFYDFDGPPVGAEVEAEVYMGGRLEVVKLVRHLEGIFLDGRLAVVFSDKGYGIKWERGIDNEVQLRMGMNLVVYALTQEGSIAQKQIEFYTARR